ncbi:PAS domain-containing sensor histidine kinase [Actinoplanes sp. N902-109]|uniref:hybrid sensor histidine kinase/response regulator n=1 Tax=Actinoplanes sp. (strain N902-109) TaxID=649831 RepID=UPI0003294486|nr:PAS domain-containing sensor histidine kinase [Actinoplanes sp. N902-109]AGL17753.1 PAS/PAC sensor hybrid histidine kinase [Actinoplanes sp. N902-109]
MTALAITALYLLVFLRVSASWLRTRDPLLRDATLVFAAMTMWFVLMVITLVDRRPPDLLVSVLVLLVLSQPLLVLRLASRLRPVPRWWPATALLFWCLSGIPVLTMPQPLQPPTSLLVAGMFVIVAGAAAVLLGTEARRRAGAARTRLWAVALGTALFGLAIMVVSAGPVGDMLSRLVALASALMYLLAFTPPRWLRRVWSWGAAYALVRELLAAPADEASEQIWEHYCAVARRILVADAVVVLLPTATISHPDLPAGALPGYDDAEVRRLLAAGGTIDALAGYTHPPRMAAELARLTGTRFVNAAPLSGPGGALVLLRGRRTLFADDDMTLVAELAGQTAALAGRAAMLAEQRRLAVVVESSHDAIVSKTPDGRITSWNAGAERLYGWPAAEIIGRDAAVLFAPDHRAEEARLLARVAAGERVEQHEAKHQTRDGRSIMVSLTSSPITDATGRTVGVACTARDITGLLLAQAERERLAARAERDAAERRMQHARRLESLGQLAGGVAHDFNNILAVIASYTELLTETVDDPDARGDLAQIGRAVERATGLTKQLLAFGRREITRAQVLSLNHVIGDVEEMLRRSLGEHIHLVAHLDRELWPVCVDPGQIEQILLNLAVNARDAMPEGGTLSIDTANVVLDEQEAAEVGTLSAGRYARIRVSDTGCGMPPEVAERASEPFYTTKPQGAGTGLGLATVYGIASAAGGHVRLYSEPGIGTTVTIVLPASEAPVTEAAAAPVTAEPARAEPRETILLVEDEAPLRDATTRILRRAGYQVLVADGGDTALRLAREHDGPIHLLLTDVIMPGMLGNQVAARVHDLRPDVRVLYMSGYAQPVLTENGTLPPGVSIIEKPFTRPDLLDRIHHHLHAGAMR